LPLKKIIIQKQKSNVLQGALANKNQDKKSGGTAGRLCGGPCVGRVGNVNILFYKTVNGASWPQSFQLKEKNYFIG
jgi:hypothetical protein